MRVHFIFALEFKLTELFERPVLKHGPNVSKMTAATDSKNFIITLTADPNYPDLIKINQTIVRLKPCAVCHEGKKIIDLEPFLVSFQAENMRPSRTIPYSKFGEELQKYYQFLLKHYNNPFCKIDKIKSIFFFKLVHEPSCNLSREEGEKEYITQQTSMNWTKFFELKLEGDNLITYLKIDPHTVNDFSELDQNSIRKLCFRVKENYLDNGQFEEIEHLLKYKKELGDTCEFPEYNLPPGFKYDLHEHQKRNLSWMCNIESPIESEANSISNTIIYFQKDCNRCIKARIAQTPYYLDLEKARLTKDPTTDYIPKLKLNGGVLIGIAGSGKKVTALALIHSHPQSWIDSTHDESLESSDNTQTVKSRATLIISTRNNYFQWIDEAKKCNPNFKIFIVPDNDYKFGEASELKSENFIDADIVIMTYNSCGWYGRRHLFRNVHFYRIILDEYKECLSRNCESKPFILGLKSDFVWALGTENMEINCHLKNKAKLCKLFKLNLTARLEITGKYFKMNKIDCTPRQQNSKIIRVKLTEIEKKIIESKMMDLTPNLSKMRDKGYAMEISSFLLDFKDHKRLITPSSLEHVESVILNAHQSEVDNLMQRLIEQKKRKNMTGAKELEESLAEARENLVNAKEALKTIKYNAKSMSCSTCHGVMTKRRMTVLECAHAFCFDCICDWVEEHQNCPKCKKPASIDKLMCIKSNNENGQISRNDYGSKFISMYNYIMNELECDPKARIIIYIPSGNMAYKMDKYLKKIKMNHVRLEGFASQRHQVLNTFRTSLTCRVMLACYDDGVTGVHVPEATHLVYYHPFSCSPWQADFELEMEGIQMVTHINANHPITVVEIITENAIETGIFEDNKQ